tara:strand:+ start:23 stop:442 length:420 start_codon:yes stop_codon:yes gene_type:complete
MDKSIDQNPDIAVGVGLPFRRGNMGYFNQEFTTLDQVKANIKNLLLTMKGERIMQPTFGTDLYKILFEPMTDMLTNDISDVIREAVNEWLPYVILQEIKVDLSPDNVDRNEYHVSLKFSLQYEPDRFEFLTFNFIGAPK